MKKFAIFLAILVIIVAQVVYMYISYQNEKNTIENENKIYESYLNTQKNGIAIATIINKAMDSNYKNNIEKDNKGRYISNDTNSVNIDFKMLDNDEIYNMETIFNGKVEVFASYYGNIQFRCTKIDYHKKTGKVKYLLFEQVTK